MNTLGDLLEFNGERASRHISTPDRGWRIAVVSAATVFVLFAVFATVASATPTTTFWAPSTATCQAAGVPHITYDTYFGKGPAAGSQGAPNYPIDAGLTIGLIPSGKVQAEAGFDLLLPSQDPLFLNAKLCTPESSLFMGSPDLSFGIYSVGTKKDVTDYSVLHFMRRLSSTPSSSLDKALQPVAKDVLWTVQLDVDVPLGK